ncbi:MAG: hypothetical protein ACPG1Z_05710 [Planctomycetota bacterium]
MLPFGSGAVWVADGACGESVEDPVVDAEADLDRFPLPLEVPEAGSLLDLRRAADTVSLP